MHACMYHAGRDPGPGSLRNSKDGSKEGWMEGRVGIVAIVLVTYLTNNGQARRSRSLYIPFFLEMWVHEWLRQLALTSITRDQGYGVGKVCWIRTKR